MLQNLKEKFPDFAVKMCKTILFVSEVLSCNPSARLEKFCWPVMIVKLRKGRKYPKILKTIRNFYKILQKSLKSFHCLMRLSSIPISRFETRSIKNFRKFENFIKIYQKIA